MPTESLERKKRWDPNQKKSASSNCFIPGNSLCDFGPHRHWRISHPLLIAKVINRLLILLERAETEIRFWMANGMCNKKMDIDRHGPRLMPNNCQIIDPPYFSLPNTFKKLERDPPYKTLHDKFMDPAALPWGYCRRTWWWRPRRGRPPPATGWPPAPGACSPAPVLHPHTERGYNSVSRDGVFFHRV